MINALLFVIISAVEGSHFPVEGMISLLLCIINALFLTGFILTKVIKKFKMPILWSLLTTLPSVVMSLYYWVWDLNVPFL